jgi:alkaline phosphatase D
MRLTILCFLTVCCVNAVHAQSPVISRIAFGSCAKQDKPMPIWDAVNELQPQLFLFLGDNIYADTEDMAVMQAKYQQLADHAGLQQLRKTCTLLGTWDDHDFGVNDGGREYPRKRESQQLFLDFFGVPKSDPRRTQEGVYSAQVLGPVGKRVQIILLDSRYFRSPLKTGFTPGEPGDGYRGKYAPETDPQATMLGEPQWKWLEAQLKVPAEIRILGTSVQLLADEHGSEMWGNFPLERQRLLTLIKSTRAQGLIVLSGDRHLAEIARLPADHPLGVGYPLYDITSTSLNAPSGNFTKAGVRFANEINSYRVGLTYFDVNFGSVLIDWDQPDPVIRAQVRDEKGGVVLQQRLKLSDLHTKAAAE